MFKAAEVGSSIAKSEFRKQVPVLRHELLVLQQELLELAEFPVIVVFAGVDGAGKVQTVNLLNEWMDPRWIVTRAYNAPSDCARMPTEKGSLRVGVCTRISALKAGRAA